MMTKHHLHPRDDGGLALRRTGAGERGVQNGGNGNGDGARETITGGEATRVDLDQVLNRGENGISRGGAVSGAAQLMSGARGLYSGDSLAGGAGLGGAGAGGAGEDGVGSGGVGAGGVGIGSASDRGIALSDGSRITFTSIAEVALDPVGLAAGVSNEVDPAV
jgi:hypothetical protein